MVLKIVMSEMLQRNLQNGWMHIAEYETIVIKYI